MYKIIQNFFLKRQLKSFSPQKPDGVSGSKFGVLYNVERFDEEQIRISIENNFDIVASELNFLGFCNSAEHKYENDGNVFSLKDFTLFGQHDSEVISAFINQNYKVMFNFFDKDQTCLELISQQTKAELKVGFSNCNQQINDLLLILDANDIDFFRESSKYIKHIL